MVIRWLEFVLPLLSVETFVQFRWVPLVKIFGFISRVQLKKTLSTAVGSIPTQKPSLRSDYSLIFPVFSEIAASMDDILFSVILKSDSSD